MGNRQLRKRPIHQSAKRAAWHGVDASDRGLGLEFARQYLDDGWQVYAACRDPKSASELRRLTDASDHKLRIIALDVTDTTSVKAAAAELEGRAIDVLINNAGVGG